MNFSGHDIYILRKQRLTKQNIQKCTLPFCEKLNLKKTRSGKAEWVEQALSNSNTEGLELESSLSAVSNCKSYIDGSRAILVSTVV